jgi:hypothetical protein
VCRRNHTSKRQKHKHTATFGQPPTLVPGTLLAVETDSSGARLRTSVKVRWELPGGYFIKTVPIRSVTFLGGPDDNAEPRAGATMTPAPAVARTTDEDAAHRQEEIQAYSGPDRPASLPQAHLDELIVAHGVEWHRKTVLELVGGLVPRWSCSVRSVPGDLIFKAAMPYVVTALVHPTTILWRCFHWNPLCA